MSSETLTQSPLRGTVRDVGRAPKNVAGGGKEGGKGRDGGRERDDGIDGNYPFSVTTKYW